MKWIADGMYACEESEPDVSFIAFLTPRNANIACDTHNDDVDALTAEIAAKDAVIDKLLALYKPEKWSQDWKRGEMDKPEYHAWCLAVPLYTQACQIAGRTE